MRDINAEGVIWKGKLMPEADIDLTFATSAHTSYLKQYHEDTIALLTRMTVGDLVITTGEVVACDPLGELRDETIDARFPLGAYPVIVCVAQLPNGMRISSYAMVAFSNAKPIRWDAARLRNSRGAGMPDQYFVDSGTGCFMDLQCLPLLAAKFTPTDPGDPYRQRLVLQIYDKDKPNDIGIGTLNVQLAASGANCVIFETGWGDDWYCSYLGYDESGTLCCLLTDFAVLDTSRAPDV